jgi:hypothetical protein
MASVMVGPAFSLLSQSANGLSITPTTRCAIGPQANNKNAVICLDLAITPVLLRISDKSLECSNLSQGAFDMSYASVGKHYD